MGYDDVVARLILLELILDYIVFAGFSPQYLRRYFREYRLDARLAWFRLQNKIRATYSKNIAS